jgi:hypothetical protein
MYARLLRPFAVLILMSLSAVAPANAQTPEPVGERFVIEGGAGFWNPTAEMSIQSESLGILGTVIDFKKDLGLQDRRMSALQAVLKTGRKHKFRFQYVPLHYEQETVLVRDIIFNGQRYRVGLPVESSLQWNAYRFGYEFDFLARNWGFVGLLVEAKYMDIRAELDAVITREYVQVAAPIPAIGGIGRFYFIPNISITGELSGIQIPDISERYDGHFADLDIYGTFNFNRNIGAQLGYRSFDVGLLLDRDSGSFVLEGIYFGVVARY